MPLAAPVTTAQLGSAVSSIATANLLT
jgi:hypothetical protein